eukprot:6056419-Pleurochrysis_carterae.AAC.6
MEMWLKCARYRTLFHYANRSIRSVYVNWHVVTCRDVRRGKQSARHDVQRRAEGAMGCTNI